jgi:hypothetical protein
MTRKAASYTFSPMKQTSRVQAIAARVDIKHLGSSSLAISTQHIIAFHQEVALPKYQSASGLS